MTIHRRSDSSVTFLLYRTQEITGISVPVQAGLRDACRVEAALEGESGFLGRVIKRADDEIFAGVTARPSGQFFIFYSEALNNFRPRNFGAKFGNDCDGNENDRCDEDPKSVTLTGRSASSSP